MNDCGDIPDKFHDVVVVLPITIRYWAVDEQAAREQFNDTELTVTGPMHSFSVGFPESLVVKEVIGQPAAKAD